MVDLETLDTATSAIVLTVGIVAFDPKTFATLERHHFVLQLAPQEARGRTKSQDTMKWWAQQSEEARTAAFGGARTPIETALDEIAEVLFNTAGVWGNGASFDNAILADLYRSFGRQQPWPFYLDRCFRTIRSAANDFDEPPREGIHHNAMHDAVHQVRVLGAACKHLNLEIR
jgi:exodeoxyribonuclease VIII